jgi:hypothetical protein
VLNKKKKQIKIEKENEVIKDMKERIEPDKENVSWNIMRRWRMGLVKECMNMGVFI